MAREYDPRGGVAYWGKFEDKFTEIEIILKQEFGLVPARGPNRLCLVAEENGKGLWHVHFHPSSLLRGTPQQRELDIIAFEYWHTECFGHVAAKEEDFQRDPLRPAAERVYHILEPYINQVTTPCLDIKVVVPWA